MIRLLCSIRMLIVGFMGYVPKGKSSVFSQTNATASSLLPFRTQKRYAYNTVWEINRSTNAVTQKAKKIVDDSKI